MDMDRSERGWVEFEFEDSADFHGDMFGAHDLASTQAEVVHGTCGNAVAGARDGEFDAIAGLLAQLGLFPFTFGLSGKGPHSGQIFPVR